ncbi:MAG: hypothetical protein WA734_17910 [Candidatus Acidiferrales bacterium]
MHRAIPWFVCLTFTFLPHTTGRFASANHFTNQTPTQTESNPGLRALGNGKWWTTLSHDRKSDFVDGYVTAMGSVHETLLGMSKQEANGLAAGDPQFNAHMSSVIQMSFLADHYDYNLDSTKLVTGVDDFYKDSLNTRITIQFALEYVRDTLNGKNAPRDLEKKLKEWREIVNK